MVTKERFKQGLAFQQYLDQMGTNKEKFVQFLQEIKIRPEDREALKKLSSKKLNVLVMTNDVAELWRRMEDLVVSSGPKSGLY